MIITKVTIVTKITRVSYISCSSDHPNIHHSHPKRRVTKVTIVTGINVIVEKGVNLDNYQGYSSAGWVFPRDWRVLTPDSGFITLVEDSRGEAPWCGGAWVWALL